MPTLQQLLHGAFTEAINTPCDGQTTGVTTGVLHQLRSRKWVESLADQFRSAFPGDDLIRVFSKGHDRNRCDFGINELLYDVLVCRTDKVTSCQQGKVLRFIQEALWQVESEFARDSGEALADFNKLVLGSARNKLFIGPHVHNPQAFLNVLIPPAKACSGSVFAALVPHPDSWDQPTNHKVDLWQFPGTGWTKCEDVRV